MSNNPANNAMGSSGQAAMMHQPNSNMVPTGPMIPGGPKNGGAFSFESFQQLQAQNPQQAAALMAAAAALAQQQLQGGAGAVAAAAGGGGGAVGVPQPPPPLKPGASASHNLFPGLMVSTSALHPQLSGNLALTPVNAPPPERASTRPAPSPRASRPKPDEDGSTSGGEEEEEEDEDEETKSPKKKRAGETKVRDERSSKGTAGCAASCHLICQEEERKVHSNRRCRPFCL